MKHFHLKIKSFSFSISFFFTIFFFSVFFLFLFLFLASPFDVHYAVMLANIVAYHNSTQQSAMHRYVSPLQSGSRLVEGKTKHGESFTISLQVSEILEQGHLSFIVLVERIRRPTGIITVKTKNRFFLLLVFFFFFNNSIPYVQSVLFSCTHTLIPFL